MRRLLTLILLGAVLALTGAAFFASYPALLGAGASVGLRGAGAYCYAGVPDLAALVAMLALMVLRHDRTARKVAAVTLAIFGLSSGVLNGAAALGVIHHGLVDPLRPPWWLALIIAAVPVAAISLGADLAMRVLASLWPSVEAETLTPRASRARRVERKARVKTPKARRRVWVTSRFPWVRVYRPAPLAPIMTRVSLAALTVTKSGESTESATEDEQRRPSHARNATGVELPAELVDAARTFAREARRDGARVNRDAVRTALRVGAKRADELLRVLREEGLAPAR